MEGAPAAHHDTAATTLFDQLEARSTAIRTLRS
ncbi:hypothetical protein P3T37_001182 [Kitasatospora sp. MAA4]|nr:hypothetical protein [Kitasatospora sp. MAA4]